jgi:hypothetical protein
MTVLLRPMSEKPADSRRRGKLIVDPLPKMVLHALVRDLPGPPGETEAQREIRFEAQLAEVMSYNPRDSADAMLASHCVLMRIVAEDARRDAARPDLGPVLAKTMARQAKQFGKLLKDARQILARRQSRPPAKMNPGAFRDLGLEEFLIPDPDDPSVAEEAFSATIVPLHPAPKLLQ